MVWPAVTALLFKLYLKPKTWGFWLPHTKEGCWANEHPLERSKHLRQQSIPSHPQAVRTLFLSLRTPSLPFIMALFFYRAWAGEPLENRGGVRCFLSSISFVFEYFVVVKATGNVDLFPTRLELNPNNPLYYTRYGYAALLGITLFGGLLLNGNNTI